LSTARRVEAKDRSRLSVTWRCCFCRDPQNPCDPTYVRFPPRPCGKSGPSSLSLRSLPQSDRNPFSKTVECQYLQFSTGLARRLEVSRASALSTGQASSGFSLTQTPNGRIITCSADAADCGAVFAAHFALSHARSLVTHPLAGGGVGKRGPVRGPDRAAVVGAAGVPAVLHIWPAHGPKVLGRDHLRLPADHPNRRERRSGHAPARVRGSAPLLAEGGGTVPTPFDGSVRFRYFLATDLIGSGSWSTFWRMNQRSGWLRFSECSRP
jgi:hypothetical protein